MGRQGLTAVELLIVGGVAFGLLGGMMLMTADAGNRLWTRMDSQAATMSAAQQVLNRMRADLHAASLAGGLTCQPGDVQFTRFSDGAAIRYQLDVAAGIVRRTVGAATQVLAGNVSAMTFPACANGVVRVSLTTRVVQRQRPTATHTLESQMRIQNP